MITKDDLSEIYKILNEKNTNNKYEEDIGLKMEKYLMHNKIKSKAEKDFIIKDSNYYIDCDGAFLDVTVIKKYINNSDKSIEALSTFLVPLQAALYHLSYEIDERIITANIQKKNNARNTYEQAIDDGKSVVLHEELLRGIHLLSVGHIPSNKEVIITIKYSMPVSIISETGMWRIPVTIGDIYGKSPFSESDDFCFSDDQQYANIHLSDIAKSKGISSPVKCLLNQPIDIKIKDISKLMDTSYSYIKLKDKNFKINILPTLNDNNNSDLSLDIICDISGSMKKENKNTDISLYNYMRVGLLDNSIKENDNVTLWEFNENIKRIDNDYQNSIYNLQKPNGGTCIGKALESVIRQSDKRDILIITDGKSYDLNIHKISGMGKRISVILIGKDSLEANIGHLALLTGGQLFFTDDTCGPVIKQAYNALRYKYAEKIEQLNTIKDKYIISYGGLDYHISLCEQHYLDTKITGLGLEYNYSQPKNITPSGYAIVNMLLPYFTKELAEDMCLSNHIVSYLTSLILLDNASEKQNSLPNTIKIPLMKSECSFSGPHVQNNYFNNSITRGISHTTHNMYIPDTCDITNNLLMGIDLNKKTSIQENYLHVLDTAYPFPKIKDIEWMKINNGDYSVLSNISHDILNDSFLKSVSKKLNVDVIILFLLILSYSSNDNYAKRFYRFYTKNMTDNQLKSLYDIINRT